MVLNKLISITYLLIAGRLLSLACGPCGCQPGTGYWGILPQIRSHFVGVRYGYYPMRTGHGGLSERFHYHAAEWWGRFFVHRRIQLLVQAPYNAVFSKSYKQPQDFWINKGMGDMRLWLSGVVLETPDTAPVLTRHFLVLGGGLKMPTGTYNRVRGGQLLPPTLQAGTGSWDWLLSAMYTFRHGRWGVQVASLTWLAQENPLRYAPSSSFQASAVFYYWYRQGGLSILPQAGASGEYLTREKNMGLPAENTGGHVVHAVMGCDVYWNKLALGLSFLWPAAQHLNGGLARLDGRLWAHFSYFF